MYSSSSPVGARARISKDKEAEILAQFETDLAESSQAVREVHERAIKAQKHYTLYVSKDPKSPYFTDSYDGQFFGSLTAAVANEFAILNAAPYFLKYEPRSEQGDALTDFYNAAFDYHWQKDPRRLRKLQDLLLQRRLYGTVYAKLFWCEEWRQEGYWKRSEQQVPVPMQNTFDGMPSVVYSPAETREWVTERRKKMDSPCFDTLNFFNCFPDTRQKELQDGRFFIHRERRTHCYIEEQAEMGNWSKSATKAVLEEGGGSHAYGSGYTQYVEQLNATVGFSQDIADNGNLYDVFEYWTPKHYAVIINRRVVCYREGHLLGYMPLMHVRNYYVPGEHFGMSDYQVIEKTLSDFQNMHNTMLTNTYLNAFPPLVVGPGVELKEFRYRPGGIIRINQGDAQAAIRQLPVAADQIDAPARVKDILRGNMDNTLATSDTTRGALPTRTQSATAVAQASASLSARQGMQAAMLETEFIQPLGEGYRDMMSKLQSEPISTKLRGGKEWVTIQPLLENYDPDLDCMPIASTSKLSELEQKRLMEAMNIAANFKIPNVNLQEAFRAFVESLAPRLADRLIMDDDSYRKMMEQQAMLQRLMEPPSGNDSPGPMATDNQIGTTPEDQSMNEMAQEMGTEQQL